MTRDNYEIDGDGKPTKVVRDGGRVVTKMLAMDSLDAVINRELGGKPKPMVDAAMHRAGYRTQSMLQQHTTDTAVRTAAHDAKEAAYMDYQRDLILAHEPAAERNEILSQLADARSRSAMESFAAGDPDQEEEEEEEEGEEDEDDDKKEKGRNRRQDARSKRRDPDQEEIEEREKDDPDGDCSKDARSVASPMSGLECPTCGGNGISSGGKCATCNGNGILNFQSSLVPGDDKALRHFQTNEAVRATQTHTESTVRRDIPDEQTLKQMLNQKNKAMDAFHATEGEQFRKALRGET